MSEPPRSAAEGAAGRYAIYGEIARGGMATVHVGRLLGPRGFNRTVAIKRLHPQYAEDPNFAAMFLDEARTASRVRHPNVVPTLDVVAGSDQLLLVMEYVPGETLRRLVRAAGDAGERLAPDVVSAIVAGVLHGLHAAHEAKNDFGEPLDIVHRDVSPQNILVGTDGVARVLDFGIAKAASRLEETKEATLKGKVAYMAPEQIRGVAVSRRTDVFAAGIVLWEALTGERLFVGDNDAATLQNVLTQPVRRPSEVDPQLPREVDDVVLRALERDPSRRYGTARDMALALERAVPPALPSKVGAWVEKVAAKALAGRADKVAEVESSSARGPAPLIISSSEFVADALWGEKGAQRAAEQKSRSRPPPPNDPFDEAVTLLKPVRSEPSGPRAAGRPAGPPAPWWKLGRTAVRNVAGAVVAALAIVGMASLALPGYAKQQAIAAASRQGLDLTIDAVHLGLTTVRLLGVHATSAELPGVKGSATEVSVELSGLSPTVVTVQGGELAIDGAVRDVLPAAERWYAAHHAGAPTVTDTFRVETFNAHLSWTHAFATDARLESTDLSGTVAPRESRRLGDEFRFTTQTVTATVGSAVMGPWRVDVVRELTGSRVRVAFDPAVPDGPNVLFLRAVAGSTGIELNVPRTPLFRLGIPPPIAGSLPTTPSQIEAKIHYQYGSVNHAEGTAELTLVGAHLPKAPAPMDVKLSGSVSGDPRSPLDVKDGTLVAGPIRAVVTGTVTVGDGAVESALSWKSLPVPCSTLAAASARRLASSVSKQLVDLGVSDADLSGSLKDLGIDPSSLTQSAAFASVSGVLTANGTVTIDTSDTSKCAFTATVKNNCGLALFGK